MLLVAISLPIRLVSALAGLRTAEIDSDGPRYTGLVDEDGFCKDLLAVQAMSGAMVARQASGRSGAGPASMLLSTLITFRCVCGAALSMHRSMHRSGRAADGVAVSVRS